MVLKQTRNGKYTIRHATEADVKQMAELQLICFPTLSAAEILTEEHFANHVSVFPEGQLVVTDNDRVIASSSNLRIQFPSLQHRFMETTDNLWITGTHQPAGDWLYQFDIGVRPEYRGLKLSTEIYSTQQEMVRLWRMNGQMTVGMTIGYMRYQDIYTIEEYCEKLKNNEITDPTVTPQRKAGFQWITPIYNYLDDPMAGNCGIFMGWSLENVSLYQYLAV